MKSLLFFCLEPTIDIEKFFFAMEIRSKILFRILKNLIFFSVCISATHVKPPNSSPSVSPDKLEAFLPQSRPLRRIMRSVAQSLHTTPSLPNTPISDTSINEIFSQLSDANATKCHPNNATDTALHSNQSLCNQTESSPHGNLTAQNETAEMTTSVTTTQAINSTSNTTLQTTEPISNVSNSNETVSENGSEPTKMSSVSITGITFGVLMFVGITLTTSYVLYRRNFTNKLHTLNDKCSNLDSSGYIDDSSIRVCLNNGPKNFCFYFFTSSLILFLTH